MNRHQLLNPILKGISRASEKLEKEVTVPRLLAAWFSACLILSLVIFLKFYLVSVPWIVSIDIVFYFIAYYAIPVLGFGSTITFFAPSKEQMKKKGKLHAMIPLLFFCVLLLFWIYATVSFRILPDYLTAFVPIALLSYVYFTKFSSTKQFKKSRGTIICAGCILVLFLPYVSAYQGYSMFLDSARSSPDATAQAIMVSKAAMAVTGNGYAIQNLVRGIFQGSQDFSKFLISGAGACGETSMLEQDAFQKLGYETMKVEFPGEDHAFVEVKINSTWLVIDPGYGMNLVSKIFRAQARINEVGTISYVDGFCSNGTLVELTQDYVPTDTIILRVTRGTNPIMDASIKLVHQLRYGTSSYTVDLPGNGYSFYTDSNGTITIHLGKICQDAYNSYFSKTDPFYKIYVNGQPTDYTVNSTGTGLSAFLPVDLAKH